MLNTLRDEIRRMMKNEVKDILKSVRNTNREGKISFDDKADGSPVTEADIKIGKLFVNKFKELLPGSIVINEEDFNKSVFEEVKKAKYVWIVDPIDGTRAFCDINNPKYCVGVALLENMRPILSVLYVPEFEINGETDIIIDTIDIEDGIKIDGNFYKVEDKVKIADTKYVCHIRNDKDLIDVEKLISNRCKEIEIVKSKLGHSTLINYMLVAIDGLNRAFSKREVNIWDIAQSAYIVEKAGGKIMYEDGTDVFPLDLNKCTFIDNKLVLPFTIAGNNEIKNILKGEM